MGRLIVKNFGPLKDIDIEINKVNLFIGENGSGKSILAKIITIVLDITSNHLDEESIKKKFIDFNIDFIDESTIIEFSNNGINFFKLENMKFFLEAKNFVTNIEQELKYLQNTFPTREKKANDLKNQLKLLKEQYLKLKDFHDEVEIKRWKDELQKSELIIEKTINELEEKSLILKKSEKEFFSLSSTYIPAERNLISLFSKSLSTLLVAEIPLPKFLLQFSSEFEKARNEIKELEFLNVKYISAERDRIYYDNENYLDLEQSSSGIQSALPLYLTIKYFVQKHRAIIIEELEQNLFPKAQEETIKYIIEQIVNDNDLFMMTHSPYVLSTLNILLYAYKAGNLNEQAKEKVLELIPQSQWINPDKFSAYYLEDGIARNIKGRTGLISENEIDNISDDIVSEFEELLDIYREHKNDE